MVPGDSGNGVAQPLRVAGLFAGIGGFERGLEMAGHETVLLCENDASAATVLRSRFPGCGYAGDIRRLCALLGLPEDPQMLANDYIVDFDHPQHGVTKVMGMPVRLSETPGQIRTPAPELGQHTEEVLIDILEYDWDRLTELRKREII